MMQSRKEALRQERFLERRNKRLARRKEWVSRLMSRRGYGTGYPSRYNDNVEEYSFSGVKVLIDTKELTWRFCR